ncbi:MAG TPA: YkgJ family cysteine cluster protein [Thermodesulfovibrionales bacterium]|nr:YkgJ family cysteine cluster protein [Thermodesulfovibrionales bacterium]
MELNKLPEKERLCIVCSKCCREIGIYTHPGMYTCSAEELIEFYEARGFTVTRSEDVLVLSLKIPCPHLTPAGCDIYERRPQVCKEYSGLDDFGEACLWSKLPEQRKHGRK